MSTPLLLGLLTVVRASLPASVAAQAPESIALTVSGGASLGSYEAGYLYYVTRVMQANPDHFRLQVATGASAGSTNAALALLTSCLPPEEDPFESAFFRVWGRVSFNELLRTEETAALGALSRAPLEAIARDIGILWDQGLPESCDVVLGIAATRVQAYSVNLDDESVELPRTEEKFSLRIRGRGMGRPPDLSNYVDVTHGAPTARLPVDGDQPNEFEFLSDLVMASSAFPIVFAPQRLRYCVHDPREADVPPCTPENARSEMFVDGGILDNQPLTLAARIAIRGLVPAPAGQPGYVFRDAPDVAQHDLPEDTYFVFLDPHAAAYPKPDADEDTSDAWSALDMTLALFGSFVQSARADELRTIVETNPGIRDRIQVTRSYFPQISSPLGGFFGLFDRGLTRFDFILGMYDARRLWSDVVAPGHVDRHGARGVDESALVWPDPAVPTGAWRELACMRGFFEHHGEVDEEHSESVALMAHCAGLDRTRFLPVLQTTLERLYVSCHLASQAVRPELRHTHCERAQEATASPPRVPGLSPSPDWQRRPGEGEGAYTMRRLAANGFVFRDLGLAADESDRAMLRIREELGRLAQAFQRAQPHHRTLIAALEEVALNELLYRPPRHIVSLEFAPHLGLGYSFALPYSHIPFLRLTLGLSIRGVSTLFSSADNEFGVAPTLGLEFEPVRLSGSVVRGRLGLRAGYGWNTEDGFGDRPCSERDQAQLHCSRMFVDSYGLITLVDIVRAAVGVTYAPPAGRFSTGEFGFWASVGLQWRSSR